MGNTKMCSDWRSKLRKEFNFRKFMWIRTTQRYRSVTKAALELELRSPTETEGEGITVWINKDENEELPKDIPLHDSPKRIERNEVPKEIEELTKILIENGNGKFSKHTIVLRVVQKDQIDMTLIDLPGMIRVVGKGEEEEKQMVDDLILHY